MLPARAMKIALAQINTTVGDFDRNIAAVIRAYHQARDAGARIVVAPELATCGYPPRDLLAKEHFVDANLRALQELAAATHDAGLVVGYVDRCQGAGRSLTNSVALLRNGRIVARRHKSLLPSYDVFDEDRYFEPATENLPVDFDGQSLGLTVCEDLWNDEDFWRDQRRYANDPVQGLLTAGVDIILNASASPWHLEKESLRHDMLRSLAKKAKKPVVYCNLVGGNDELVFDGGSMVFNAKGKLIAQCKAFAEDLIVVDVEKAPMIEPADFCDEENVFRALVLGVRDYMGKCGFKQAVIGLSGGIDSALTAVVAAEALGRENVRGVAMPSQYSSEGSRTDARVLAGNLGIQFDEIPIEEQFNAVRHRLADVFAGRDEDVTEENIQARIRGVTMMAMSNKFGSLLLTTGNKSELAVGYCTLYGDMCGGLAVISDVPKTLVYRISKWINRNGEIIPEDTITKPPSAELRPDQKDQDSLPEYDILDAILERYVVDCRSVQEIITEGFDEGVVRKIVRLIDLNEYKRRQAAPGLKVTSKAFGMGRRMPIAQRFKG